jgi:hypothetical protein
MRGKKNIKKINLCDKKNRPYFLYTSSFIYTACQQNRRKEQLIFLSILIC